MSKSQELMELTGTLSSGLIGDEGLASKLASLLREARQLEALDPGSKLLADRLNSSVIELADLGAEFSSLSQELNFDPDEATALQERMNAWLEAKRRYGPELDDVLEEREKIRQKLEMQGDIEGACAKMDEQIRLAEKELRVVAAKLRVQREKAARDLAKVAAKAIAQLGFKKADFGVRIEGLPDFGPSGDCRCEFIFSPNVGEAPLPLNRIASSGELARVMLALKTVLADLDEVPVLVFDEVDANVGGEIGRIVGEKMAQIAKGHQVFCVTHLPQVAAQGRSHFLVEKDQSKDRVVVNILPLHDKRSSRIEELARMLGDRTAKSALSHAEELLKG
jgi:DNA repair protein RecN (Recombination protein N)